ncbi:homoserine O-acetyltransferase [candidate division WOR-1 bacterium RIFOXYD2_FULL_36_8]|uniref:Homoserine O-acetyltransferase n=1 Tax=candidate division WOR-1 bacterium RIFOXYB2_FULL_36_35 TaxID=1802578 RepID=A0A1F4S154_UNCSA|nr:MAG: homoserine O-acetyltransferase [candidate division WOR-1 bacterium RIFOXYA2_FULL_36_21]OGC13463.1 MAG: homoserine O-acetyltransferase [candidate division WOR-1 bacterium RIFOXYB2_FULL_36_35]OGC21173.1 MAG: homoserine O-acetyltransferase [candidate division WOR-1 bacterium RIFOXYA12_FULL_36_13]OGC38467.1 MAG: homoserine O-acetyltransferase [candidate division WOR-1 bacterium RIFOXYD2_FULL_36_8]
MFKESIFILSFAEIKYFTFEELNLEGGKLLGPVTIAYQTYGCINEDKSNAILIFHALSGDAHVAGKHSSKEIKPGWWDGMVGSGKAFDTDKYFVICANVLGGCMGSTGPSTVNPKNKKPYAMTFPSITIKDMAAAQIWLLDDLGVNVLHAVAGGSMGGMIALQFSVSYPDRVKNVIAIATSAKTSPQNIAFNEVGRQAIVHDPNWQKGDYYGKSFPNHGLAIARMIGHITYLSDKSMRNKFGRGMKKQEITEVKFSDPLFEVESYLRHKGLTFTERFDANSYLYLTRAIDLFNLEDEGAGSLKRAFSKATAKFLIIYFKSDWLFPEYQSLEIVDAIKDNFGDVSYRTIESNYGHDAFLLETDKLTDAVKSFLFGAKK